MTAMFLRLFKAAIRSSAACWSFPIVTALCMNRQAMSAATNNILTTNQIAVQNKSIPPLYVPFVQDEHKYTKADDRAGEAKPAELEFLLEHPENAQAEQAENKQKKYDPEYK